VDTRTSSSSTDTRIPPTQLFSDQLPVVEDADASDVTKTVLDIEQSPFHTNKCLPLTGVGCQ
jgi:hypothetical protein